MPRSIEAMKRVKEAVEAANAQLELIRNPAPAAPAPAEAEAETTPAPVDPPFMGPTQ